MGFELADLTRCGCGASLRDDAPAYWHRDIAPDVWRLEVVSERDVRVLVVVWYRFRGDRALDALVLARPIQDPPRVDGVVELEVQYAGDGAVLQRDSEPEPDSLLLGVKVAAD